MKRLITLLALFLAIILMLSCFASAEIAVQDWNASYGTVTSAYSIALDSSDNIFLSGWYAQGGPPNYRVVKYNSTGSQLATVTYTSSGMNTDISTGVAVDSIGDVIITGYASSSTDYHTIKYNNTLSVLWSATYNSGFEDKAYDVGVDSQNNIIVTGKSNSDYFTIKYNLTGNHVWNKTYNGGFVDVSDSVAIDSQDNVIVAGHSYVDGSSSYLFAIKYNSTGDFILNMTLGDNTNQTTDSVAVDSSDNIVISGTQKNGENTDFLIAKYNSTGTQLWNTTYGGAYTDPTGSVAVDSNDNILLVGTNSAEEYLTIKYDRNGNMIWSKLNNYYTPMDCNDVAVDFQDNVIVTGNSNYNGMSFYTIKYRIAGGIFGINDSVQTTGLSGLIVKLNGSTNLAFNFSSITPLEFMDDADLIFNWTHDFGKGDINLSKIVINKSAEKIAFDLGNQLKPGDMHSFIVPNNLGGLYYCPLAKTISAVNVTCNDIVQFLPAEIGATKYTSDGSFVTVNAEGSFLRLTTNSTQDDGGGGPTPVPEFSTITLMLALVIVIAGFFAVRRRAQ